MKAETFYLYKCDLCNTSYFHNQEHRECIFCDSDRIIMQSTFKSKTAPANTWIKLHAKT